LSRLLKSFDETMSENAAVSGLALKAAAT